ncbi:FkbM family methyltransferase [Flavobacterium sp. W4I14]|nr:FkbM family methyltransferase [Flavobacterium sp. W4I14]
MRIFIDVGGHFGETVEAVLDPTYKFDKIYSFEPVKECADIIRKIDNKRVEVIEAGLLDTNIVKTVYKPGSEGASIFEDHWGLQPTIMRDSAFDESAICNFMRATNFFESHITEHDEVVMKLNCEGSECNILLDLIESDQISKIKNLLIDFDARKIPSQEHLIPIVISKLNDINFRYYSPEEVQYGAGSHFGGIRQWLHLTNEKKGNTIASIIYHIKNILHKKALPYYKFQIVKLLPTSWVDFYYKRIK